MVGACHICGVERNLVVDHDHGHGRIRGHLCRSCNTILGTLENEDRMERFNAYLSASHIGRPYYKSQVHWQTTLSWRERNREKYLAYRRKWARRNYDSARG